MPTKKVSFLNPEGIQLSALLELPLDQKPDAFALFAHCFTCGKSLAAVRRIANALTRRGFGVLRFDFTGLGESEGEFADTNFSSNVQDLLAAAAFLERDYEAPELLIGHSLGGAAAIFAALDIVSIRAIVTVGAPASPAHVQHLFGDRLPDIAARGTAEINIGGRPFTVKQQFLDDIGEQNLSSTLRSLRKPLLILHSPADEIVGIDNARELFEVARHPKSFVSLDRADHLLSDTEDATYAGEVIAGWAKRYVTAPEATPLKAPQQVLARVGGSGYTTEIQAGRHYFKADEPARVGGDDFGPTPYDLLLASLGACTAMTLRMYADRKQWPLTQIDVHLSHRREHVKDCEDCDEQGTLVDRIDRQLSLRGDLDPEQTARLLEIADKCPVHKTLHNGVVVTTGMADADKL